MFLPISMRSWPTIKNDFCMMWLNYFSRKYPFLSLLFESGLNEIPFCNIFRYSLAEHFSANRNVLTENSELPSANSLNINNISSDKSST